MKLGFLNASFYCHCFSSFINFVSNVHSYFKYMFSSLFAHKIAHCHWHSIRRLHTIKNSFSVLVRHPQNLVLFLKPYILPIVYLFCHKHEDIFCKENLWPQGSLRNDSAIHKMSVGSSINDVTQFWTIFDPPSFVVTCFIIKALVLSLKNPRPLSVTVTSFKDDPYSGKKSTNFQINC